MATISVDDARYLVSKVYKGDTWKAKVRKMPDKQVLALYYSFLEKGKFDSKPKNESRPACCGKRAELPVLDDAMDNDVGYQMYFDI